MKPETLELQQLLDPTTGAQAVEEIKFPFAATDTTRFETYIALSGGKEIVIRQWKNTTTTAEDKMKEGKLVEIPIADFIAELKSIIAELEK